MEAMAVGGLLFKAVGVDVRMRIAICDDEAVFLTNFRGILIKGSFAQGAGLPGGGEG